MSTKNTTRANQPRTGLAGAWQPQPPVIAGSGDAAPVPPEAGVPDALVAAPALEVLEIVPPALAVDPPPAAPAPPTAPAPAAPPMPPAAPAPLADVVVAAVVDGPVDTAVEDAPPVPPDAAEVVAAVVDDGLQSSRAKGGAGIQQPTMQ